MQIKPIKNDQDHQDALKQIETLMNAEPDSPEEDLLDILVALVERYEEVHYPIAPPDPIEAIKFVMDQRELKPKDLEPMIGKVNRVYEILNGKRQLTLPMIRKLHAQLGIPYESLLGTDPAAA